MNSHKTRARAVFASVSRHLAVPGNVRLRTESFGAVAFDKLTGTMVELDPDAMTMLTRIRGAGTISEDEIIVSSPNHDDVRQVVERLLDLGILAVIAPGSVADIEAVGTRSNDEFIPSCPPPSPRLTAPETVHWAITYQCEQKCPDCYARRHVTLLGGELDTKDALQVVDKLAKWGVFQLAIGGGEPLLRPDLPAICEHAHRQGLVVHVTTGYHDVTPEMLRSLKGCVSVLQIGAKHEKLLADSASEFGKLTDTVCGARVMGIAIGANMMLSNTVMTHFSGLIELLVECGMDRITLLRYKPPADQSRWRSENPSPEAWLDFERRLPDMLRRFAGVVFRIDCAFGFLQRNLIPADAAAAGIRGCVAGDRILALTPDGNVFPCSQLVNSSTRAGNIITDDAEEIWVHSKVMCNSRAFRQSGAFRESRCGACGANELCGGCRVFADDRLGADPGCPESISPGGES